MRRSSCRTALTVALVAAGLLAGCGGQSAPRAPNAKVAPTPRADHSMPGLETAAKSNSSDSVEAAPCALVTRGQAAKIMGETIAAPITAPQGPTCIYQAPSGRQLVTVAVQTGEFKSLQDELTDARRVRIAGRDAVCGTHGQAVLYMPVTAGRVLTIAAPCEQASEFADDALHRLTSGR